MKKHLETWYPYLSDFDFGKIFEKIDQDEKRYGVVYPSKKNVFKAFRQTPYEKTEIIILGQDPYPSQQAMGIAFGVNSPPIPSSLKFIHAELKRTNIPIPSLDFKEWDNVLMLNAALTNCGHIGEHLEIWRPFIERVLEVAPPHKLIMLGKVAQSFGEGIKAPHPNSERYRSGFIGSNVFEFLK